MIPFLRSRSTRPSPSKRSRRLRAEPLENRRVLAGAIDTCLPMAEADVTDVAAEESTIQPLGPKIERDSNDQNARPFKIKGDGFGTNGLPLDLNVPTAFSSIGNATGLGKHSGEGNFILRSLNIDNVTGAVTGTFEGDFVFTAANGDPLAVTFGDGGSGIFTAQMSADGSSLENVKFDAFFRPDQENSDGRFARVVGGGWRMIARADSISLAGKPGFTAPFDFTWSGEGELDFAKKSK